MGCMVDKYNQQMSVICFKKKQHMGIFTHKGNRGYLFLIVVV